jgi:hypothetical protein
MVLAAFALLTAATAILIRDADTGTPEPELSAG